MPSAGNSGNRGCGAQNKDYAHPAQDEDVQPPQPEPPDAAPDGAVEDLPMPKRDMSFSVLFDPHFSQVASGFVPKTSFSKSAPQALQ
jgi:hypothetical protein